jgi:hypothetical protein
MEALQRKSAESAFNLPADVELLDIKFDLSTNELSAVIRSDSFEDIAETYPIPEYPIICASNTKGTIKPVIVAQPITSFIAGTQLVKKSQPQTNQSALKMAEEFSSEQRKLLSFTVSEDCVIVKPIQFLKAEWNDINETVKSIGGKWVKGDIVSYWSIPLQQS